MANKENHFLLFLPRVCVLEKQTTRNISIYSAVRNFHVSYVNGSRYLDAKRGAVFLCAVLQQLCVQHYIHQQKREKKAAAIHAIENIVRFQLNVCVGFRKRRRNFSSCCCFMISHFFLPLYLNMSYIDAIFCATLVDAMPCKYFGKKLNAK